MRSELLWLLTNIFCLPEDTIINLLFISDVSMGPHDKPELTNIFHMINQSLAQRTDLSLGELALSAVLNCIDGS